MIETNDWSSKTNDQCSYENNSVTASRCCITALYFLLNTPGKKQTHCQYNVADRAEDDEVDDTEDNCSFGVESVLIACRLIVAFRF